MVASLGPVGVGCYSGGRLVSVLELFGVHLWSGSWCRGCLLNYLHGFNGGEVLGLVCLVARRCRLVGVIRLSGEKIADWHGSGVLQGNAPELHASAMLLL